MEFFASMLREKLTRVKVPFILIISEKGIKLKINYNISTLSEFDRVKKARKQKKGNVQSGVVTLTPQN